MGASESMGGTARAVLDVAEAWVRDGERVALAMVAGTKKSAPRPVGTKMAVSSSGQIEGAVSGGCVEGAVVEEAESVMATGEPRLLHYGISDAEAWDVGLQCGGEIAVWVEPFAMPSESEADDTPERLSAAFRDLQRAGRRAALVTLMRGPRPGAKLLRLDDGTHRGTLGDERADALAAGYADEMMWAGSSKLFEEADDDLALFVDVSAPAPRLFIFGAVDFSTALCTLARFLGWRPFVIDPRGRFAQPARFPDAEQVVAEWPQTAFERLGGIDRATSVVVLTHDPKLDDAALRAALASDAPYIGAMGSRTAQAARRERLLEAGIDESLLERISAPVGLNVGALTPEETALSIMGEIVALQRGRDGGRLANAATRIHPTTAGIGNER
ncbi:XdhC family protein [Capillimicrobium parvum]|uniref:Xanthine dehydrogenase subunit A n=1 Tax=Capillimicrobium parvum TaxID=2884022 RepID=A0A9E6XY46_9ACTN|nr:XdhC/CoxI family protein [Capillimicrobium parvum]UGS35931.1 putative xanthine dehydrogenase subunit A [Capillimicrobium parvum]